MASAIENPSFGENVEATVGPSEATPEAEKEPEKEATTAAATTSSPPPQEQQQYRRVRKGPRIFLIRPP